MKKDIPTTKEEFAAMLMRDYGHSEKLAKDCAAIVAAHGAFEEENPEKEERLNKLVTQSLNREYNAGYDAGFFDGLKEGKSRCPN